MNYVDVIILIVILLAVFSGWSYGFISGTLGLISWVGSILIGFLLYQDAATFFDNQLPALGGWASPLAFILIIILARIIIGTIIYQILRGIPEKTHAHPLNKFFGVAPGIVNGLIYAALLVALLLVLPLSGRVSAAIRNSLLAPPLTAQVEWLENVLSPVFDEAVKKTLNKLTVSPGSSERVDLPFKVAEPEIREDLEAEMLDMLNKERNKEGLPPLKADPELTAVARKHSREMFAKGYFSHISPDGMTPTDRLRKAGVTFLTAGENIALAQTVSIAHTGLMNSPGHRANILKPAFGRSGIGILDGGMYGLMITQHFRN